VKEKPKVFVGVSGGVDSSVALALLKKEGYDVTGVFLKVWNPEWLPCSWREERRSAMRVCAVLDVPFMTLDCEAEYKKEVADYMIREYSLGNIPNPDIFCNTYIKFGIFLKKALEMGADYVATGHYARIIDNQLAESKDKEKDQSYFLYTLTPEQLKRVLFPVGNLTKPEVRKLAKKFNLPTAEKKDSQGLCFIGKLDMKDFLSHYIPKKRGDVLNSSGEVIGYHDGAVFYAIGERHGFTITKKTPNESRLFVVSKNIEKNTIMVADLKNKKKFSAKEITLKDFSYHGSTLVRIRYRQEKQKCRVENNRIIFEIPQNGVSIGQSAVLYEGEKVIGGGIIESVK